LQASSFKPQEKAACTLLAACSLPLETRSTLFYNNK
jgi:hypothetical protein